MNSLFWDRLITLTSFPYKASTLKVVQTHISYIFITDSYVYKIKKPVNFGFLDFTTLEKRKFFCEKEVQLNKRLCPDLYIGVVPVTKEEGIYKFEGKGEPVEYAVKMKKLPENGMMSDLLRKKEIIATHIDMLIDVLVPFYKTSATGKNIDKYGDTEIITYNTEENFEQTRSFVGKALKKEKYNHIVKYTRDFIKNNEKLFKKRIKEGYIREGHGDLYSANICFDDFKKVYVFDCIEFNERFRCGDVCSDIAFLAMDLDYHRYKDLADYFIDEYVKKSGDKDLLKLLNFYKCYRAYVRGKIGCFTYASSGVPEEERKKSLENAQKYFDLAYLYAGGYPKIIIFMGLSGTGKTFLAHRLLKDYPAVYISSDVIRKTLLNLDPSKHYYAEFEKGIYSPEITEKTYKEMIRRAEEETSYGRDVILDATFRDEKYRNMVIERFKNKKVKIYWIWCYAEDEIIKQRMLKRKEEDTYSDALWEIYLSQKQKFIPPTTLNPLILLDTAQPLEILEEKIKEFLKN
ncbi:MAG: aminoglycoside phosphotransferase [Thermodesulfobacteriota bacterium]|nr:MAG: aminoglycoside phosphotransferase [Thermodesulfobacteriota bacterium]